MFRLCRRMSDKYWEHKKPEAFARLRIWRWIRFDRALREGVKKYFIPAIKLNFFRQHKEIFNGSNT